MKQNNRPNFYTAFIQSREIGSLVSSFDQHNVVDRRLNHLAQSWHHSIPSEARFDAGISAMTFDDAESRFLICGSSRGSISIVDFEESDGSNGQTYPVNHKVISTRSESRHKFMVNCCQWYPVDSSVFATSGMDKIVKIWDATRLLSVEQFKFEQQIFHFHWLTSLAISSLIAVATSSSNVTLLDIRTGNSAQQIRCRNRKTISSVRWLPSSNYVLATGNDLAEITLWDVRSGRSELAQAKSPGGIKTGKKKCDILLQKDEKSHVRLAHQNMIVCLRCTSDGLFLVSLSQDRNICMWEADTLRLLSWIKIPEPTAGDRGLVTAQFELSDEGSSLWAFVPNGSELVVVRFKYPFQTNGRQIRLTSEHSDVISPLRGHYQSVNSCAYRSTYQQLVTSAADRLVLVWAPKMDECQTDSISNTLQALHEDAYSDEEK